MKTQPAGYKAIENKGWLMAHKWLIARRLSQVSILTLFLLGPLLGLWIMKGNLSSSVILDTIPLTEPYVLLQTLFTGHVPSSTAIIGVAIVLSFYLIVSGRVFCAWVCPVNIVTDSAHWLRERLGLSTATRLSKDTRYWLLAATLIAALVTGHAAWENINPVSMLHRGLIYGMGAGAFLVLGIFLIDFSVSRRGWCGHLCPMGAFYSLLATHSLIRVRAEHRDRCDDCMDCFQVCPEQQVIRPALKGASYGNGPVITSANCTNCGRCIDVCAKNVFQYGTRFNNVTNNQVHETQNNSIT